MIIDTAHLDAQTCGDSVLQCELLALFVRQAEEVCHDFQTAVSAPGLDPHALLALLHRFKGSARAIGATRLADRVEQIEARVASEPQSAEVRSDLAVAENLARETVVFATALIDARDPRGLAKWREHV